jgi:8-oxo-dGTP pyrophosphatase MutT (NUDIX family)
MRKSIASIALIERNREGEPQWLAQWNPGWSGYHFVGGGKRPDESHRECLVREIEEELGLRDGVECRVSDRPRARLQYLRWSDRAQTVTEYAIEVFETELRAPSAVEVEGPDGSNRWLSLSDIRIGRTPDGRAVSPTMGELLERLARVESESA